MLIHEISAQTGLTKKAIEYYMEQGLIIPSVLENGYRDFNGDDLECLKKISVLRKLGVGIEDIRNVLEDKNGDALLKLSVQKELHIRQQQAKKAVLEKLCRKKSYAEIQPDLKAIEDNATITEQLLESFPGYYGRYVCLHFSRFLNDPIITEEQREAFFTIRNFLDDMPPLKLPADLQDYLIENTKHISTENIRTMMENVKKSIESPDEFLSENKEFLEQYLELKKSEEYKQSPAYQIQAYLNEFNSTSGYYEVFIPALKVLSPSYAEYYKLLEVANEKLLSHYPFPSL